MMKKTWIMTYLLSLAALNSSCGQIMSASYKALLKTLYKNDIPLVSCQNAYANNSAHFLDTRAYDEFKVSHIPEARWVGYEDFSLDRVSTIPKDTPIIVYCSVGVRSERIGKKLLEAGYTNVYNLYGSLFEWVNQGYPIVDSAGNPTDKVHAYSRAWGIWLNKGEKVYQ